MAETLIFAGSVEEALAAKNGASAFLAGGTEINRLRSSVTAEKLISIKKLPALRGIAEEDGFIRIGAATTFQEAVDSPLVPGYFKEACRLMASRTKRNMATVGGNIALLRDDSYILPCLIAAKATLVWMAEGKKEEGCPCCFMKAGKTKDALLLYILLAPERRVYLKRYANTAMSCSVMNLAYGFDKDGGNVAIGAAFKNAGLMKLAEAEKLAAPEDAAAYGKEAPVAFKDDMYGSAAYKRYLLGATIEKFMLDAKEEVRS